MLRIVDSVLKMPMAAAFITENLVRNALSRSPQEHITVASAIDAF
jgi:hypothetical protein